MSENILSLEDLKFLEKLHSEYGMKLLSCNDSGIKINNGDLHTQNEEFDLLYEITRKLRYRLNSNFQMNFLNQHNFNIIRI